MPRGALKISKTLPIPISQERKKISADVLAKNKIFALWLLLNNGGKKELKCTYF